MDKGNRSLTWVDYWDSDLFSRAMMKSSTRFFVQRTKRVLKYGKEDILLDFGCGPGYLEEFLAGTVGEMHGLDTSPRLIAECRENFGKNRNIYFHKLDRNHFSDLSIFEKEKFTIIICLSVVQYFNRQDDLEKLIRSVQKVSAPGALFLIADIPTSLHLFLDAFELLRSAFRERFFFMALRFILHSRFSEYYRVRSGRGLMSYPVPVLNQLIDTLDLDARILREQFTYNRRRAHLFIRMGRKMEDQL
jgi:SAM-dependent methyltransferase